MLVNIESYFPQASHVQAPLVSPMITSNRTMLEYGRPTRDSLGLTVGLVIFYSAVLLTALTSNIFILLAVFRGFVPLNTVNTFLSSLAFSDFIMVVL